MGQRQHVVPALKERWQVQLDDLEPEEEVQAKGTALDPDLANLVQQQGPRLAASKS